MEENFNLNRTEDEEQEIDILDLARYVLQNWIPVVAATLVGAILGFIITAFIITPVYEAKSSIYVVSATANSAIDLTDLNIGTSLTNDYKHLVSSRTLLENVIADTGYDLTPNQLSKMLTIGNDSGTRILEFTVSSKDPVQAMNLANSLANQSIIFLPDVMGVKDNIPTIIDPAIMPEEPSNIKVLRNSVIGALIGFVLVVGVFAVMYFMNDSFDSSEDVEKYLGIVPMAVVPENGQKHRGNGYYYTNAKGGKQK